MTTAPSFPSVALDCLDNLWFQVAGTLCNLTCNHCFISCSPKNHTLGFLDFETVKRVLAESRPLGVKEYYFTGGEPFMNNELPAMLEETLRYGPASVLTNATLLPEKIVNRIAKAERESLYSLELRVSLDGFSPETNDPIRGEGTFERAMQGVEFLVGNGFLPIITAMRSWRLEEEEEVIGKFTTMLKSRGYDRPRLKLLPSLKIGQEAMRTAGYTDLDWLTDEMMEGYDKSQLLCTNSRIVTDKGVHVCPILVDQAGSNMGATLAESTKDFPLAYQACMTCYAYGSICSNVSSTVTFE